MQSSLFLFIRAQGEQVHLSKIIAPTTEVNKNALSSGINADRTMPNTAPIGLLVQIICEIPASFLLNSYYFSLLLGGARQAIFFPYRVERFG